MKGIVEIVRVGKPTTMSLALTSPKLLKSRNRNGNGDISALLNFSVPEMTPEQLETEKRKSVERKANAQVLADKIVSAKAEIAKIEEIQDWDMNPDLVSQHSKLLNFLGNAEEAGDATFKASLAVSNLINRIKTVNPQRDEEVSSELRAITKIGRGSLIYLEDIKNLPEGAVRFKNLCLIHIKSKIHPDKIASPADQSIFMALRVMIGRYLKTANKDKVENLKGKGDSNLTDLKNKKSGIYRIHFSELKGDGFRWEEGVALVELVDISRTGKQFLVIEAIDGAGSLRWLADHRGKWVPYSAILTGKVVEEKTPAEFIVFAKRFAKAIHKALYLFEKGQS